MGKEAEVLIRNENTGKWERDMICLIPDEEVEKLSTGSILDLEDEQTITQYEVLEIKTSPLKLKTKKIAQKIKVKKISS